MSIFSCVMGEVQDVVNQVVQQSSIVEDVVGNINGEWGRSPAVRGLVQVPMRLSKKSRAV
jgi:hypothetical protein